LLRRLAPDYRTIAAFRYDNPEAIVSATVIVLDADLNQHAPDSARRQTSQTISGT
jgi:hypothetical protein